jgi:hypothetical protein
MRSLILLAVVVVGTSSPSFADPPAKEPKMLRPVMWWSGLNRVSDGGAGGDEQTVILISDAKEFNKVWTSLGTKVDAPQVNFKDYFVLVVRKPLGLDLSPPFGHLALDDKGEAKIRGLNAHPDSMNSRFHSSTIALFPRSGIKTVEGSKLPAGE